MFPSQDRKLGSVKDDSSRSPGIERVCSVPQSFYDGQADVEVY